MKIKSGPHLSAHAEPDQPGHSHFSPKVWAWLERLARSGVRAVRVLGYISREDLDRLRALGFSRLNIRAMHGYGVALPDPAQHVEGNAWLIDYALSLGFVVSITWANEPNLELRCTPAEYTSWYLECCKLTRKRWGSRVILDNPAIAGYAPNSWEWWDGTRACVDASDRQCHHLYPRERAEMKPAEDGSLPAWSLQWWEGQHSRPVVVTEMGARTDTDRDTRRGLIPDLIKQVTTSSRVDEWYLYITEADGPEHAEHEWEEDYVGWVAAASAPPERTQPAATPVLERPSLPTVDLGGLTVYDLRGRWNGRRGWEIRPLAGITAVVSHHTTGGTPTSIQGDLSMLDAIDVYHRRNAGPDWPGAPRPAYTLGIGGLGSIYLLNDLDQQTWSQGSPWNRQGVAVAMLGTEPTAEQLAALARVHVALERALGRGQKHLGHRECMPGQTECPTPNWASLKPRVLAMIVEASRPVVPQSLRDAAEGHLHALWALDERTHRGVAAIKEDLQWPA